jgi:hypothetical protein
MDAYDRCTNLEKKSCRYCYHLCSRPRNFQTTHVLYYTRNSDCKDEQKSKHLSSSETLQNVRSHGRRVRTCPAHQSDAFIEGFAGITPRRWSSWKLCPVGHVYCLAIKITWNISTTDIAVRADTNFVGACTSAFRVILRRLQGCECRWGMCQFISQPTEQTA